MTWSFSFTCCYILHHVFIFDVLISIKLYSLPLTEVDYGIRRDKYYQINLQLYNL